jgi:hypothetical protein
MSGSSRAWLPLHARHAPRVPPVAAAAGQALLGAVLALAMAGTAGAASSASWVSLEGVSASVGSLSASVQTSSESWVRPLRAAQGPHRVTRLEAAPAPAGIVTMHLQPDEDLRSPAQPAAAGLLVRLPERTLRTAAIAVGDRVDVREQAHGLEFAHGEPLRVFFLALRESGLGQLSTRPLGP